jgi:Sec23/Sec24 trunk domain
MLVMSDVDDVFLPKPNDLLVNLSECKAAVESLLGRLNDMFADNHTIGSALGPALQSGFKLIVRRSLILPRPRPNFFFFVNRVPLAVNSSSCPPLYRALELVLSRTGKIRKY